LGFYITLFSEFGTLSIFFVTFNSPFKPIIILGISQALFKKQPVPQEEHKREDKGNP